MMKPTIDPEEVRRELVKYDTDDNADPTPLVAAAREWLRMQEHDAPTCESTLLAAAREWNEARGSLSVARSVHDGPHREISDGYARLHAAEVALMQAIDDAGGAR